MPHNYLITGGAGFIGTNLADHYLASGRRVTILDNFARAGTRENVRWLREKHGDESLRVVEADIRRDYGVMRRLVDEAEVVNHLAAQVAVTTSVKDPREDFEINALGTFNVMEAVRESSSKPVVIYTSTNKVYGKMGDVAIADAGDRYAYADCPQGIPESRSLDFYSPYGCSKGTGDQYVIDYARIYDLKTVVFRQSCIYGPHQFGIEDQGWVAWFAIQAMRGGAVCIYGDGKQVRDVLYVGDLIRAFENAVTHIDRASGNAYNIGGGPDNTLSLLELLSTLESFYGQPVEHSFDEWRPGDQLVYVSDIAKARRDFDWTPRVGVREGLELLLGWLEENRAVFTVPSLRSTVQMTLDPAFNAAMLAAR